MQMIKQFEPVSANLQRQNCYVADSQWLTF